MNLSQVRLRLRPQLVIVLALEHLATHTVNSLHYGRALHSRILDACSSSIVQHHRLTGWRGIHCRRQRSGPSSFLILA